MHTKTILIPGNAITQTGTFTVPSDFASLVAIHAIGGTSVEDVSNSGWGGAAWAVSYSATGLTPGQTCYYQVGGAYNTLSTNINSWFNISSNTSPSTSSLGVSAQGAGNGNQGHASQSIGDYAYDGGTRGTSGSSEAGSGGGGAAGPNGSGAPGGDGYGGNNSGGAGGGGAGDSVVSGNGQAGLYNAGGQGGISGNYSGGGGVGATTSSYAAAGQTGTGAGGGGGYGGTFGTLYLNGANGAMENLWFGSVYPDTSGTGTWAGPGGGGGGAGAQLNGVPAWVGGTPGTSLGYGGGAGGSASIQVPGGPGLIVFQYKAPNQFNPAISGGVVIHPGVVFS